MPTGEKYFNSTLKRVVSFEDMRDNIVGYLRDSDKLIAQLLHPQQTVFGVSKTVLSGDGPDQFKLGSDTIGSDGLGNILDTGDVTVIGSLYEDVDFGNEVGSDYDVALRYAAIPSEIRINPRTGKPEYNAWEDAIGYSASPSSVVDNLDGTMTVTVNSVLEATYDNTGRKVIIWKNVPADGASTEAIAIETITASYNDPSNIILTTGSLGQTTISETASDYTVVALGPSVFADTSLKDTAGFVYIGTITGNGPAATPTVFSNADQRLTYEMFQAVPDITRLEALSPNKYKVSVSANALDEDENQLEIKGSGGATVFGIDGHGTVTVVADADNQAIYASGAGSGVAIKGHNTGTGIGMFGQAVADHGVKGLTVAGSKGSIYGEHQQPDGYAVYGYATGTNSIGVYGRATNATTSSAVKGLATTGTGVFGETGGSTATGVYGYATDSTGANFGVRGVSESAAGIGVLGDNTNTSGNAVGVAGTAGSGGVGVTGYPRSGATGNVIGIYGSGKGSGSGVEGLGADTGSGVKGTASGTGYGIWGAASTGTAIYGEATTGTAVYGEATTGAGISGSATTGDAVYGTVNGAGRAVYGYASNSTGASVAVEARNTSETGKGIYTIATDGDGANYGIHCVSQSDAGWAIYADNTGAGWAGHFESDYGGGGIQVNALGVGVDIDSVLTGLTIDTSGGSAIDATAAGSGNIAIKANGSLCALQVLNGTAGAIWFESQGGNPSSSIGGLGGLYCKNNGGTLELWWYNGSNWVKAV